jgi:energy-coupling factor transporter ATP-binding protein EcfA2
MMKANKIRVDLGLVTRLVAKLDSCRIKHSRFEQVLDDLEASLCVGSPGEIQLVFGPTGVGKTTMAHSIAARTLEQGRQKMMDDASIIPTVVVEASSSGEGKFTWRSFYQDILHQLEGGNRVGWVDYGSMDPVTKRMTPPKLGRGSSLASLRAAAESALHARGTKTLIIDEAAHIMQGAGKDLQSHLDTFKSLANKSGVQIVLMGSYDLYRLALESGQLARRIRPIHFERFHVDRQDDIKSFFACVKAFQEALPEVWGDQLFQFSRLLMHNTLGCVGSLRKVLAQAVKERMQEESWSQDVLVRALFTDGNRSSMENEILEGEEFAFSAMLRTVPDFDDRQRIVRRVAA